MPFSSMFAVLIGFFAEDDSRVVNECKVITFVADADMIKLMALATINSDSERSFFIVMNLEMIKYCAIYTIKKTKASFCYKILQ